MNKTLYIRDEDAPVWERARELSGEKLSPVIVDALKKYIAQKEAVEKGFERIVIEYADALDHYLPKIKAFYGRWIIPYKKPLEWTSLEEPLIEYYSVAITAKGSWVVYFKKRTQGDDGGSSWSIEEKLRIFSSRSEAAADKEVGYGIREAVKIMGVPVEELDI